MSSRRSASGSNRVLILAVVTCFCLGLAAVLITFFLVVLFWETNYRLAVVGCLALLYLAAGDGRSGHAAKSEAKEPPFLGDPW